MLLPFSQLRKPNPPLRHPLPLPPMPPQLTRPPLLSLPLMPPKLPQPKLLLLQKHRQLLQLKQQPLSRPHPLTLLNPLPQKRPLQKPL